MTFKPMDLVNKAINLLKAANAEYSIIAPDGTVHSSEPIKKKATRDPRYKPGERTAYLRPYLNKLDSGAILDIPFGKYDGVALRGSLVAELTRLYGAGSTSTSINHERKVIEVLRLS